MKVDIETLSTVKRALSVEVESSVVDLEFASAYADLGRRVKIAGFRPGKIPLAILEKRYYQDVVDDVARRLIPRFYEEALKEAGLVPVQLPTIDRVSIAKAAPLSFRATVEVRPPMALQPYRGLPVVRRPIVVDEAEERSALDGLRQRQAQLESFPNDHLIGDGDFVVIDFEGIVDGHSLAESGAKGYLVHMGGHSVLPEIEAALLGRRPGERTDTVVTFPADHTNRRLAGRAVTFQIQIADVKRQSLPEVDDEFAKDLGVESLAALQAKIREEIIRRKRDDAHHAERRAILQAVLDAHQVDLPPSLVQRETELVRERLLRHLEQAGRGPQAPGFDEATMDREAARAAEERVKGDLLLEAIAEREGLSVTQEEIEREVQRLAVDARSDVREVRKILAGESGTFVGLRATLLREKTLDWLHAQASIREEDGTTGGQEAK